MKKEELKKEIRGNETMQKLFTIERYKNYCIKNNLKENNYQSLKNYKSYCLYLTYK